MKIIDLFAGIGGLRLGFEKQGAECVFSSENDKHAQMTYEANFNKKPAGDIYKVKSSDIPAHDILLAGFPCQPFSIAGYRKGLKDERGNLFFQILRILRECRPKAFLLENVKGLINLNKGRVFRNMTALLQKTGYQVYSKVLNTMEYGNLPQTRERIYITGIRKNLNRQFSFPPPVKLTKTIHDILSKQKQDDYFYYDRFPIYKILKKEITKKDTIYQWRRTYVRENKSKVCPTLTANTGTGGHNVPLILDHYGIRKLTPKECAGFQGFPDSFILPEFAGKGCLYKQIGNSVSIPVIENIAANLLHALAAKKTNSFFINAYNRSSQLDLTL